MRIASLLPSATEIVCALGATAELVGRSHECDFPPGIEQVPVLTSARIGPLPSSRDRDQLERLSPEVVLVKPCGFDVDRTLAELDVLRAALPASWPASKRGSVHVADGNAFFNRPGPRIVESLEILAACVHPEPFGDFAAKHAASMRRISGTVPSSDRG